MSRILYKYLDAYGAKLMLINSNLKFTNATQLNDPFDCHPSLIDFSHVPPEMCGGWSPDDIAMVESDPYRRNRESVWICSLSKINNNLLMWSYYNKHKGVCVGIDMDKAKPYLSLMHGLTMIGCSELEVQYKNIIDKPDHFNGRCMHWLYQLSTKAEDWKHEQEVRLYLFDPYPDLMRLMPGQTDEKGPIDVKEIGVFPYIGGECYDSIYLGVNMNKEDKEYIINIARKRSPDIKIYQMDIDPNAFKLIANIQE